MKLDVPSFLLPTAPKKIALDSLPSNPGEEWRPVVGYADRYMISNKGRVMRKPFAQTRIRNGRTETTRYPAKELQHFQFHAGRGSESTIGVRLARFEGDTRIVSVGRLMLQAFTDVSGKGLVAAPLDGDASNLELDNWAWATHSERQTLMAAKLLVVRKLRKQNEDVLVTPEDKLPSIEERMVAAKFIGKAEKIRRVIARQEVALDSLLRKCKHDIWVAPKGLESTHRVCAACKQEMRK
jgi:NUMOD4 motif